MMHHIRDVMRGLASEVPVMFCICGLIHHSTPSASTCQLLTTQDGLSEMHFTGTCKLYVNLLLHFCTCTNLLAKMLSSVF
jgi:hypothetical protein